MLIDSEEALERFFRDSRLKRSAAGIVRSQRIPENEVEELVQIALLAMLKAIRKKTVIRNGFAYAASTMRRTVHRARRRQKRMAQILQNLWVDGIAATGKQVTDPYPEIDPDALEAAMASLPPGYRTIVKDFAEGKTLAVTAARFNSSISSVYRQRAIAFAALANLIAA